MATQLGYGISNVDVYYGEVELRGYVLYTSVVGRFNTMPGFGGSLPQGVAITVAVFASASDGTPKTGLVNANFTVKQLSKNAGALATITPTITEIGAGWYAVPLTAANLDTPGDLVTHFEATGADPINWGFSVAPRTFRVV
jgi:hypothetical protein